ncbi:MAG: hypothetical protein LKI72_06950, partial [Prevotella sp.]|nr:hypothetical protein [Prevotella sp.]
ARDRELPVLLFSLYPEATPIHIIYGAASALSCYCLSVLWKSFQRTLSFFSAPGFYPKAVAKVVLLYVTAKSF